MIFTSVVGVYIQANVYSMQCGIGDVEVKSINFHIPFICQVILLLNFHCIVMPMTLFVKCVGDLATIGGSVLFVTSFSRSMIPSLFVCENQELVSLFYSGDSLTLWPS